MAENTKTTADKPNGALTYAYTDIARAPSWHVAVAQYSAAGMTQGDIADVVGVGVDTVHKVLQHEPIQMYMRAIQARLQLEERRFHHTIRAILGHGLSSLLDHVKNHATTPSERLRIVQFAADRLPDGTLADVARRCRNAAEKGDEKKLLTLQGAIDEMAAGIWNITDHELRAIQHGLRELDPAESGDTSAPDSEE